MRPLVEMERSGLVPLLQQDQHEDLARMHKLFSRVQGGHDLIRTMMSEHLRKTGRQLVEDPEQNKDPVSFVERLLTEKDKFDAYAPFLSYSISELLLSSSLLTRTDWMHARFSCISCFHAFMEMGICACMVVQRACVQEVPCEISWIDKAACCALFKQIGRILCTTLQWAGLAKYATE